MGRVSDIIVVSTHAKSTGNSLYKFACTYFLCVPAVGACVYVCVCVKMIPLVWELLAAGGRLARQCERSVFVTCTLALLDGSEIERGCVFFSRQCCHLWHSIPHQQPASAERRAHQGLKQQFIYVHARAFVLLIFLERVSAARVAQCARAAAALEIECTHNICKYFMSIS